MTRQSDAQNDPARALLDLENRCCPPPLMKIRAPITRGSNEMKPINARYKTSTRELRTLS